MRRRSLGHFIVWFRFDRVYQVWELYAILDKEDGHIIANQIVVAILRVEFGGKTAHIAHRIGRAARANHR